MLSGKPAKTRSLSYASSGGYVALSTDYATQDRLPEVSENTIMGRISEVYQRQFESSRERAIPPMHRDIVSGG